MERKSTVDQTRIERALIAAFACLLALSVAPPAQGQGAVEWLNIGDLHHWYSDFGSTIERGTTGLVYPGINRAADNHRSKGYWIGARNLQDQNGEVWDTRVFGHGPRGPGVGRFFPQRFEMRSRFQPPEVTVDGFQTFDRGPVPETTDPDQRADRLIDNVVTNQMGLTMERTIMQFSQEYHSNYHLVEYTFTNTGEIREGETLPEQTLQDVYIFFLNRTIPNRQSGWSGTGAMNDAVAGDDFVEDYGVDFRAQYTWAGFRPWEGRFNSLGGPLWDDGPGTVPEGDSVGRLSVPYFVGRVYIHADRAWDDPTDDFGQPSTMTPVESDDYRTSDIDEFDVPGMQARYELMSAGRVNPTHARTITPDGDYANQTADPSLGFGGGWGFADGFGPYTIPPGESIRLVIAEGAAGLSDEAALEIGRAHRRGGANRDNILIPWEVGGVVHEMTKNDWVMTARDSLFQMFERARANYQSGYNIPQPPMPPREFHVESGTDRISLEWDVYPGAQQEGWEIWRATPRYDGILSVSPYQLIAELGPEARNFVDDQVQRGVGYFYYIQAVGPINEDDTGFTPTGVPLKSSRYYTQTYDPAFLKREPGATMDAIRIVPNPFNLASSSDVRWPDQQDRIGFLDVPGNATIQILTQLGELIETIEHTDGSGDAYWNLTTSSRQVVSSGIYIALITNNDTGEQVIQKFAIIR